MAARRKKAGRTRRAGAEKAHREEGHAREGPPEEGAERFSPRDRPSKEGLGTPGGPTAGRGFLLLKNAPKFLTTLENGSAPPKRIRGGSLNGTHHDRRLHQRVPNRFHLVQMASIWTKQLKKGASPSSADDNKEVVIALREIAAVYIKPDHPAEAKRESDAAASGVLNVDLEVDRRAAADVAPQRHLASRAAPPGRAPG